MPHCICSCVACARSGAGGLLKASAHVPLLEAARRAEAAKFRGVSYHKRHRVFEALLQVRDGPGYIGRFKTAKQAAEARDQAVRRVYPDATPDHKFQRKEKLNFPSEEESCIPRDTGRGTQACDENIGLQ